MFLFGVLLCIALCPWGWGLVTLLCLSSWGLVVVVVLWLLPTVPWAGLQCVIAVFSNHTHFF